MIFKGVATALITPFKGGEVDFEAYEALLDMQLAGGVSAVVALGTTGEPATLTAAEKKKIISFTVAKLRGLIPVIVGVGSNSTAAAEENAALARELKADGALVVTPYYNKCTQSGLKQHFTRVAKAARLPLILYNVPSRTGVNMLPETFGALARSVDNIVAVKEASGNMEQIERCVIEADGKAAVYSGDDGITVPVMAVGGAGVISVASNILPRPVSDMAEDCLRGDFASAAKKQLALLPFVRALFNEVNPIPVKYAAEKLGIGDGGLRLPLTRAEAETKRKIDEALDPFL